MSYWAPYVPVAKRHAKAKKQMDKLRKKGQNIQPIEKTGRIIAKSFWGKSWCDHLESFSDYDNRLPRGRTYVRNGSVCHLEIKKGQINAMVSGSAMYKIKIQIKPLSKNLWQAIRKKCSGSVSSLLELLQGKLSENVMQAVTNSKTGLFPLPGDIDLACDCPDWATMCKHVAAVLYGIGTRLDHSPELLFILRDVDHKELIASRVEISTNPLKIPQVSGDLSDIFGIDLDTSNLKADKKTLANNIEKNRNKVGRKDKLGKKASPALKAKKANASNMKPQRKMNISRGITAYHIKKLQKMLSLSEPELAELLGKSLTTIRNWKSKDGILNLQTSSLQVLTEQINRANLKL